MSNPKRKILPKKETIEMIKEVECELFGIGCNLLPVELPYYRKYLDDAGNTIWRCRDEITR